MLSGECRIEATPVQGQAFLIDGLRLQLDLRLAAVGEATRHELPVLSRAAQKLAAAAGLAALLLALALWRWGSPTERAIAPPATPVEVGPVTPAATPAPPASIAPAPPVAAAPPVAPAPPVAVPPVTPARDSSATTASVRPVVEPAVDSKKAPLAGSMPGARVPTARVARPAPVAAEDSATAVPARRPPATLRSANRDLIDLFGDTK